MASQPGFLLGRDLNKCSRFLVSFPNLADFEVDCRERTVSIFEHHSGASEQTIQHLLLDQLLPRLLACAGDLVVHAAGFATVTGSVLLTGLSGKWKSTLAASFHAAGHLLLGDDAMIVHAALGAVSCRSVYRSLRLHRDSIEAVLPGKRELAPVAEHTDKQNVIDLGPSPEVANEQPVRAVYCLGEHSDTIRVNRMSPGEACMALVEHSFWLDPADLEQTKSRLITASEVAKGVPVFNVAYPRDYGSLPRLRQIILGGHDIH
jgi:hypothetical protein